MKKMRVIDLFNVKFEDMTDEINKVLDQLQNDGHVIHDVKVIGEKLQNSAVFVYYEEAK